jgi:hypothetical protein
MKYRRQMVCGLVVVAVGLVGCSGEVEKLTAENERMQAEKQELQDTNAALKDKLAAMLKEGGNSLSFPADWASQKSAVKELDEFGKTGAYEGTHDMTLPDGNVLHMKSLSKVTYGNGGTCLINASVETQRGMVERNYALQVQGYDREQQVYRAVNVFQNGSVSISESRPEDILESHGAKGQRKRKWHAVYNTNIPESAELETIIEMNKDRDEVEWSWAIREGSETMVSGKGVQRRIE